MRNFIIKNKDYIFAVATVVTISVMVKTIEWALNQKKDFELTTELLRPVKHIQHTATLSPTFYPPERIESDYVNIDSFFDIYHWYNTIDEQKVTAKRINKIMEFRATNPEIEPSKIAPRVDTIKLKIKVTR